MRDQSSETLKIEADEWDSWHALICEIYTTHPDYAWWNDDFTYRRYNPCGGGHMNKVHARAAERTMKAES